MSSKEEIKEKIKILDSQIEVLSMKRELLLCSLAIEEDDTASAMRHMANAVDLGYLGNYGYLGAAFGGEVEGLETDYDKAKYYLQKFYNDYKLCKLEDVSADNILVAIYNLAATETYICDRDGLNYSPKIINNMLSLYKEMIDIAEIAEVSLEESTIDDLYKVGIIMYTGRFSSTKREDITFKADKDAGKKAIKLAAKMGNQAAIEYIKKENI